MESGHLPGGVAAYPGESPPVSSILFALMQIVTFLYIAGMPCLLYRGQLTEAHVLRR